LGFGCALVLLLVITNWPWIALLFPLWILVLSVRILLADFGRARYSVTEKTR
jgi:predicted RND superfamily exporter protein